MIDFMDWCIRRDGWILMCIGVLAITLVVTVWGLICGPRTVSISTKQFECTSTTSIGIEAVCTQYTKISVIKH